MDEELNPFADLDGGELSIEEIEAKFMADAPDGEDLSGEDDEDADISDDNPNEVDEIEEGDDEADEDEEVDEDPDEDTDEVEDEDVDEDEDTPVLADDDAEVTYTVDGTEHRASVKDLKRLAGQEAALTQKSQSVSEQMRAVEAQGMAAVKVLQDRHEVAKAKAEEYAKVDLFRASRELEPAEFDALRMSKEAAELELKTIEQEAQTFLEQSRETRMTLLREQAKQALPVIKEAIPEWTDEVYSEIRQYAIGQGMDANMVNEVVDASAIIMMHKAMQFDAAAAKKDTVQKKVIKSPKKVAKKATKRVDTKASKVKAKRAEVWESDGDVDAIAELYMEAQKE